jgi:sulfatase maturation enzyme AslB (radical SAM superfamily)
MQTVDADLLAPGPIHEIRLDLTMRCNLRCVYCLVSQPWYDGQDMTSEVLEKAVPGILQIAAHNQVGCLNVNGHGETTFIEGWTKVVELLISRLG